MASDSALIAVEVGHQVDLIRFSNSMGAAVNPHLTNISKYVREVLYRWEKLETKKDMDEAVRLISEMMTVELGEFTGEFESDVSALIKEEIDFQYGVAKSAIGAGTAVARPTVKATTQLINSIPMVLNGNAITVDQYIGDYTPNQIAKVKQKIVAGWTDGLTTREIAQSITGTKSVKGVIQTSQRSAYMMAKDVSTHTSSQTKARVWRDNDDLIIGEKTVTTLDSRTSDICKYYGSQDGGGKEWLYSEYGYNFPRPGFHPNCRSTNVPILAKEYREIAEEGRERPAVIDGKAETVPATTNWYDLAKENSILAEQSLGASRAKLLSEMSTKEFIDTAYTRLGTSLTLEEMKKKNPKVLSILDS
jgi:hypothetical protein